MNFPTRSLFLLFRLYFLIFLKHVKQNELQTPMFENSISIFFFLLGKGIAALLMNLAKKRRIGSTIIARDAELYV